jgi:predicted  nucleic acid-binding Zn-ribbon protein
MDGKKMKKIKLRRCNLKKFCYNCGEVEIEEDEKLIWKCPECGNKLFTMKNDKS